MVVTREALADTSPWLCTSPRVRSAMLIWSSLFWPIYVVLLLWGVTGRWRQRREER